jgi:hypothetical protein
MNRVHQPSGLQRGIDLLIDPQWSPDQAMAVVELLDDLRDRIWRHYESILLEKYCEERVTLRAVDVTDQPF